MTKLAYLVGRDSEVPLDDDWLGAAEASWLRGRRSPKRIREWRLGRWTAKRALRATRRELAVRSPESVEILSRGDGSPVAVVDGLRVATELSLSHRSGAALCLVGPPDARLGCDVERIEPRSPNFLDCYFTAGERQAVRRCPDSDQPLLANLLWSAKESALKALRLGLRVDTRTVEVAIRSPAAGGWGHLDTAHEGSLFEGRWCRQGDLVLTMVSIPEFTEPLCLAANGAPEPRPLGAWRTPARNGGLPAPPATAEKVGC